MNEGDPQTKRKTAVGVFVKAPREGYSKTRLCPPLKQHESPALSRCFIQDTAENISTAFSNKAAVARVAIYAPIGSEEEVRGLLPDDFLTMPQRGELLGDRLHNATLDLFAKGFDSVCLMGADSPTLPPSYVEQMIDNLNLTKEDIVIGPTFDGGYYAIGLRAPCGRLFADIDWSTPRVFEQTKERLGELNLSWKALPIWYDVDDRDGLELLLEHLFVEQDICKIDLPRQPVHTRALLESIIRSEGSARIWPSRKSQSNLLP
jgi:rSAM/selenodomain-associated transferase 1